MCPCEYIIMLSLYSFYTVGHLLRGLKHTRWEYGLADAWLTQPPWHHMTFPPLYRLHPVRNDNSSSFSLKLFWHTTHIEGLCVKMISIIFSHTHTVTVEWWESLLPASIRLSPATLFGVKGSRCVVSSFPSHLLFFCSSIFTITISPTVLFHMNLACISNIHGNVSLRFILKSTLKVTLFEVLPTLAICHK